MEEIAHVPIGPVHNVLAFSPDNQRVAIDNGWNIKLVELKTGKVLRDIAPGRAMVGNFNCVTSADVAPDGTIIASYEDQMIRVWDASGGRKIRDLGAGPQGDPFWDVRYSRTGKWVIGRSRSEIRLWDLETGKVRTRYPVTSPIKSMDMHPNGRGIVSIHNDNVIRIWDALTGDPVREFADGSKKITGLRFSPGGRRLLCGGRGLPDFSVVNPENGEAIQVFQGAGTNVINAAFFPSELRVASVHADNIFRVWSVATGEQLYSKPFNKDVRRVGISPDGGYVVLILQGEAIVHRVAG
jgi:eukaryotic-like serine/threonine-protein kinase